MAKTASERQAAYRAKPDQYRLSLYINGEARAALTALARHRGCSQREVIESLIVAEKNALVSAMDIDDLARFRGSTNRLRSNAASLPRCAWFLGHMHDG